MTIEEATICRIFLEDVAGKYKNCNEYKLLMDALNIESCEDSISRQVAIKAIWDGINMDIYTSEVKEILEGLPSVQPMNTLDMQIQLDAAHDDGYEQGYLQAKNDYEAEWIPIKTRPLTEKEKAEMDTESPYKYDCPLPDDGEEVEVTTYLGDVTLDVFCRDSSDGCYFEHYCDDGDVLAWRRKPEPYKESEDEE